MVPRLPGRRNEGFPPGNPQVASMDVGEDCQAYDRLRDVGDGWDDHVHVDDRFGRKTGHGRATDVLDDDDEVAQCGDHGSTKLLEESRSMRIVVNDDDGFGHCLSPRRRRVTKVCPGPLAIPPESMLQAFR